jgi:hypothetical protein
MGSPAETQQSYLSHLKTLNPSSLPAFLSQHHHLISPIKPLIKLHPRRSEGTVSETKPSLVKANKNYTFPWQYGENENM